MSIPLAWNWPATPLPLTTPETLLSSSSTHPMDATAVLLKCSFPVDTIRAFEQQDVTMDLWPLLTSAQLCELGVTKMGWRVKFLTWVKQNPHLCRAPIAASASAAASALWAQAATTAAPQPTSRTTSTTAAVVWANVAASATHDAAATKPSAPLRASTEKNRATPASVSTNTVCDTNGESDGGVDVVPDAWMNRLFSVVEACAPDTVTPALLARRFKLKTGHLPTHVIGRNWLTLVKADSRLHFDGKYIFTLKSVRGSPKAKEVARYNVNGLRFAGVSPHVLGHVYHLAGVCSVCHNCPGKYGWDSVPPRLLRISKCTYCHHSTHGVYPPRSLTDQFDQITDRGAFSLFARHPPPTLACTHIFRFPPAQ